MPKSNSSTKSKSSTRRRSLNKEKKFILFGCWNKHFCEIDTPNKKNGISSVMSTLYDKMAVDPAFYIIAGDNYYPDKSPDKSKKFFNKTEYDSGMACAEKLSEKAPVYMILGNHDLDKNEKLYDIDSTDGKPLEKCFITEKQKRENLKKFNMKTQHLFTQFDNKTLIIFLNTSLYSQNYTQVDECIQDFYDLTGKTLEDVKSMLESEITKIADKYTDKNVENIVLVGHHPIISIRLKNKKKLNEKTGLMEEKEKETKELLRDDGVNLIQNIFSKFQNAVKYYLCADVHQYQEVDIHIDGLNTPIKQYVVGTGGTDLDDKRCSRGFDERQKETVPSSNSKLSKIFFYPRVCENQKYGYLQCTSKEEGLDFEFVETCDRKKCEIKKPKNKTKKSPSKTK